MSDHRTTPIRSWFAHVRLTLFDAGRAIRHRGDWAALVLVDARYSAVRIRSKLPKWIGKDVAVAETFGEAMKELGQFYREKRTAAR